MSSFINRQQKMCPLPQKAGLFARCSVIRYPSQSLRSFAPSNCSKTFCFCSRYHIFWS